MKKQSLLIIILLISLGKTALGQKVFNLDKLPKQDTLLNGWKFHAGDDSTWKSIDFQDNSWQNIDPGIDITQFKELKSSGIGWIRIHLKADSSITKKQITAWVFQYSASEIYLNGRLIKKYGKTEPNKSITEAYCPYGDLFNLSLQPGLEYVIAVKLAYQPGLPYSSTFFTPLPAFQLYVNSSQAAFNNHRHNETLNNTNAILSALFSGIFLIISFIYLIYFIFDRHQKIHLYYCLYSFFVFLLNLAFTFFVNGIESVAWQMAVSFAMALLYVLSSLLMLITVYALFGYKNRIPFSILALTGLGSIIYLLFNDTFGFIVSSNIFLQVCMLEGIRISIWAIVKKKKDAVFILLALIIGSTMNIWSSLLDQTTLMATLLALMATFGFPLGMSIYLGILNAQTNQKLRFTLVQVQTLSEQNLIKEQEKQAILASQNEVLEQQVTNRTAELNLSLNTLKATQAQLIQSEKMASLGELTAGIAHEIQNPLNFVNNFSEVNVEMINELKEELKSGNIGEALTIAADIEQNEVKINHHGRRADSIVKGMLEHSRTRSGTKELTDINKLAEEYLRLSFQGFQSKTNSYNVVPIAIGMVTSFDENLPQINVVPQDIGKVLLNLYNNAFSAVSQKSKNTDADYKPIVSVLTMLENESIKIVIKDNGIGIPDAIKDKIMQPFFTTKPTGEGTGLGLSLAWDIVVNGYGGNIEVTSIEGNGSEFIICLPIV